MKEPKAETSEMENDSDGFTISDKYLKDINKGLKKPVIIDLGPIGDVGIKFKNKETIISLATMMNPGDIARLANLYRQGAPLTATVQSLQAEFDLQFTRVDTGTGEMR